jgi:hypothetical protein
MTSSRSIVKPGSVAPAAIAAAPFCSVDGMYIAFIMHRVESTLAILTGLWCLISPVTFLQTLGAEMTEGKGGTAAMEHLLSAPLILLLARMAANGILLAGALKVYILRRDQPYYLRLRFVQAEVFVKGVHLLATILYLSQFDPSRWQGGTLVNAALSSSQFVATVLTVLYEGRRSDRMRGE